MTSSGFDALLPVIESTVPELASRSHLNGLRHMLNSSSAQQASSQATAVAPQSSVQSSATAVEPAEGDAQSKDTAVEDRTEVLKLLEAALASHGIVATLQNIVSTVRAHRDADAS